jgi:uncharacterized membrane protein
MMNKVIAGGKIMKMRFFALSVVALLGIGLGTVVLEAAEEPVQKPDREIVAAFEYPGKVIEETDRVSLELIIKNNGRKDETVVLTVEGKPANWDAKIEKYGNVITGVFVPSGEQKTLTFSADEQDKKDGKLTQGEYSFQVKASTADGKIATTAAAKITVAEKGKKGAGEEEKQKPVRMTTSYPVLRGASDSEFEFSVDIHNDTEKDGMFSLRAEKPKGWEVSFKPAYENKYIGSLQIKSNLSQSVDVKVTPAPRAEVGEHKMQVFAESPQGDAEIELKVILTGTHKITCRTLKGILSLTAQKGKTANISMYVINEGSAPQKGISFTSFKPENWEVKFDPEKMEVLEPGDMNMKQVEVTITPANEALVGDYSIAASAQGENASDDIEFRVTVRAASTWGWIGVGIIIAVIVGMSITFRRLGRR